MAGAARSVAANEQLGWCRTRLSSYPGSNGCRLVSMGAEKEHFAELAVDAVLRLKGSTNLDAIQVGACTTSVLVCSCLAIESGRGWPAFLC